MSEAKLGSHEKELGSWYTGDKMSQILADWAIRNPSDYMMDPSFGGGIFFLAAEKRLVELGQDPAHIKKQLFGVDIDAEAFDIAKELPITPLSSHLIHSDFFNVDPKSLPALDCIIGNPPYVRYQQWDATKSPAHQIATELGYPLTKLSSLWAPFVLQMSRFLKPGGRMGLVLPAEILYAQYARPIQRFLTEKFEKSYLTLFETSVFDGAQEEVVLLFAEGFESNKLGGIHVKQFYNLDKFNLASLEKQAIELKASMPLFALFSQAERKTYESFCKTATPLSESADLDIGIVTGANKFFIASQEKVNQYGFSPEGLVPIMTKAGDISGAQVKAEDWEDLVNRGRPAHLIAISTSTPDKALNTFQSYIKEGEAAEVHTGYKCRVRNPWWSVPMLPPPDLFLTYINGVFPRLACNVIKARSTNSIHNLRLLGDDVDPAAFAVAFYNAGTLLSAELCGRSYGGGALKLEPTEGGKLMIPKFDYKIGKHINRVDALVREGDIDSLFDLTDSLVLHPLGISEKDCLILRNSWRKLQQRRVTRAKSNK